MTYRLTTAALAFILCFSASAARAGTVTLTADRDNTLYQSDDGSLSNGAGDHFFTGVTNEGVTRRGLVHFDLTSIPSGAVITSATLTLNMSMTIAGPVDVTLHRVSADWGEGASNAPGGEGGGAPAATGDATWLHTFFDSSLWATAGGDFVAAASATTSVDDNGAYAWGSTTGMIADVQEWVDSPADNYGWLLLGGEQLEGQSTAKRFDSREGDQEGTSGPQLVVEFLPPVPVELQSITID